MTAYVYIIQNIINGNVYIGVSNGDLHRLKEHKFGIKSNIHLQRAIKFYGIENFIFDMLEEWPTFNRALEAETEMIVYLRSLGAVLYNMNDGGMGGINPTIALRKKISCNVKLALKQTDMSFYKRFDYREKLAKSVKASYNDTLRDCRRKNAFQQWEAWRQQEALISPQHAYDVYKSAGDRYKRKADKENSEKCYAIASTILATNPNIDTRVYRKVT